MQQKYDDLKQLVDVMGRAMNYLESPDSPAGEQIKSIFDVVKVSSSAMRRTHVVNVSLKDENYQVTFKPFNFEII